MSTFRVVVVGGGPNGLTAAHALSKAGIDFVVLERRVELLEDVGASLVLGPPSMRIMSQLGLLSHLEPIGTKIKNNVALTDKGVKFNENTPVIQKMDKNHGCTPVMFHRAHLVKAIYEGLGEADKSRIFTGKKVTNIETTPSGVRAHCADGTTYEGSIIIGADGVHSNTRQTMRRLALEADAKADVNEEKPYRTEYRTMWCTFPRPEGSEPGETADAHSKDLSTMYLAAEDRSWIFLYELLPCPTKERASYTEKDIDIFADKFADLPITEKLKVKDIWPSRWTAGMANLEEGILKHWSWNRIVLIGDACHKFTPNQGLGYNNGIQDIVVLVNELHKLVQPKDESSESSTSPSLEALSGAFKRFESKRKETIKGDFEKSAKLTRMCAWPSPVYHFFDRYVMPNIPASGYLFAKMIAKQWSKALVFDFLKTKEPFKGTIPWKHSIEP